MNESVRRSGMIVAIIIAVYSVGTWFRGTLGIEFDAESVRDYVLGLGPLAPILFVFIVAFRSLLGLPSQLVLIAAGLCFGTVIGALVGGAGLMISGLILFLGARYAGREAIEKRLGPRVKHILDFTQRRSGFVALALACGYPISPLSPIHAAAGWTPMPTANFMAAAFLGGLIRSAVFAYFGDAMTDASWTALLAPLAVLAVAMVIPLATQSGREWLRNIFTPPKENTSQASTHPDSDEECEGGNSKPNAATNALWEVYPCTIGDHPAVVSVDVALADTIDASGLKTRVMVTLTYAALRADRMPEASDQERAAPIRDRLEAFAESRADVNAGRITTDGRLDAVFYSGPSAEEWTPFIEGLKRDSAFDLRLHLVDDPRHEDYWRGLYPGADDWQVILDLRLIDNLEEHGDDGTAVRSVEHWAYFDNEAAAEDFRIWAEAEGFTFRADQSGPGEDNRLCIRLLHEGPVTLAAINARTLPLNRKAAELGGQYDGWETPAIAPTEASD